jgi:hypothetical protein
MSGSRKEVIVWSRPSSVTVKSSRVRQVIGLRFSSLTLTLSETSAREENESGKAGSLQATSDCDDGCARGAGPVAIEVMAATPARRHTDLIHTLM